jgi:Lrp/AsnC family transcriptional regulator for asnA, asnC and gidA
MIDNLNQRIISSLKRDGRSSCAKLAKELGVNVATVTKRVDKMLDEDYIAIKTVLNPFKFGFNAHAFITLDIDLDKISHVCAQLVNNPNISLVSTIFGRYDVLMIVDFPNWEQLQDFITKELPNINGICKIDTFPIIAIKKIYNGLFRFDSFFSNPPSLDEIDHKIIEELGKNGRLSFADLAHKLNISLTTVSRRVANLKKEQIIRIAAVRNPSKWGYLANSYFCLHTDKNKVEGICAALSVHPEIHLVMTLMSGFEILAGIHISNLEAMYKFIVEKVARIDGVSNIETFVCAETLKRSYALFEPEKELEASPQKV